MKLNLLLYGILALTLLIGCGKGKHAHAGNAEVYRCPMHPEISQDQAGTCPICKMALVRVDVRAASSRLMLTEQQRVMANVKTITVRSAAAGGTVSLNGKLAVDQEQLKIVSSRVAGRIVKLFVREQGEQVLRGQPLYQLYSDDLQALQQEYLTSLDNPALMPSAETKLLLLGMTKIDLQNIRVNKKAGDGVIFTSPYSGFIENLPEREGQYVSEGEELYRIGSLHQLWAEAELYAGENSTIKKGDLVQIRVSGFETVPVKGTVMQINPAYREGTQLRILRVALENPGNKFVPGLRVNVEIAAGMPSDKSETVMVIPSGAVIHGGEGDHVWIQEDDGSLRKQRVTTGLADNRRTTVLSGLMTGDHVVISGGRLLDGASEFSAQ